MELGARDRLALECRPGLREPGLVLERDLQRHGSNIREAALVLPNELLDHADIDRWDIVSGCSERHDSRHAGLVARRRAR